MGEKSTESLTQSVICSKPAKTGSFLRLKGMIVFVVN